MGKGKTIFLFLGFENEPRENFLRNFIFTEILQGLNIYKN